MRVFMNNLTVRTRGIGMEWPWRRRAFRGSEPEDGRPLLSIVGGGSGEIEVTFPDGLDGTVVIEFRAPDARTFRGEGYDVWDGFRALRLVLENEGIQLVCHGACTDVHPSRMSRSMGAGTAAYRLRLGNSARQRDLHGTFEPAKPQRVGTVASQEAH